MKKVDDDKNKYPMELINVQETVISELEEEKGNFLCGPEWKVKITTKAGQELDIKQVTGT